jgi:hypothetical protein
MVKLEAQISPFGMGGGLIAYLSGSSKRQFLNAQKHGYQPEGKSVPRQPF